MSSVSDSHTTQKHLRYGNMYRPGEIYWGLGIECETYIELKGGIEVSPNFVRSNRKRERYSVDYWTIYKSDTINTLLEEWIADKSDTKLTFPLLLNAHSLCKTDRFVEPATTYSKLPRPNPAFCGSSLLQDLSGVEPDVFGTDGGSNIWWTFDGDTIEFMTQDFYCAKMEDVVNELIMHKKKWLHAFQSGLKKIPSKDPLFEKTPAFPTKNYGLAVYLTNRNNIGIFNNGTYHFNLTLPTYLDKDGHIADKTEFKKRHQRLARLFQWFTPFLIARYGSGDVFGSISPYGANKFPIGSQRLCASRFVSAGTYDTETMEPGKILTVPYCRVEGRWYEQIYDKPECTYKILPMIGMDINYNKHWNHGLEFRIFDWFPEEDIPDLFRCLIWMCDESLAVDSIQNPQLNDVWNSVLSKIIWSGKSVIISTTEAHVFSTIFRIPVHEIAERQAIDVYDSVWNYWGKRWNFTKDTCTSTMIRAPLEISRFNSIPPSTQTTVPPVPPTAPIVTQQVRNGFLQILRSCFRC